MRGSIESRPRSAKPRFRLIDLFAGAGGMTLGFVNRIPNEFEVVWSNEMDQTAAKTYNANFGNHCLVDDIIEILKKANVKIPKADVVIGGPPCQGFSLLNKKRKADPRKQLWRPFLDVVNLSRADVFVMENVPQLLGSPEHEQIIAVAHKMGFRVASEKLCAADYGAPQLRWRAFVIGCRFADPNNCFPPLKTHRNPKKDIPPGLFEGTNGYVNKPREWCSVREAIADLPRPLGTEISDEIPPLNLHFGRNPTPKSMERYRAIPREGMNRFDLQKRARHLTPSCWIRKKSGGTDLFGRLWWDRPAFTVRTEFFKPEKGRYLHPSQHRPITHREAARIQTFPDTFRFIGSKIQIAKQIGNAVPPLLATRIADCVYKLLSGKNRA